MATLKDIIDELLKQKINIDDDIKPNNINNSQNHNNTNNNNNNKKFSNQDIYNKLSTYLPEISISNLESFLGETYDQFSKLNHKATYSKLDNSGDININLGFYNLNNQFYDTINENSLKYNSVIRKDQEQQKQPESSTSTNIKVDKTVKDLSKCYSGLYYLFYINLFRILLKLNNPQDFQDILDEYYLDDLETDTEDEDDYLEQIKEKEKQHIEKISEINDSSQEQQQQSENKIEKEDKYEPFEDNSNNNNNNNGDDDFLFYGRENKIENWDIVSKKLKSIIEPISYDNLSDDSVWEDYSILEDIQDISKLLISNTQLQLQELLPNFIYILRDRMIHRPSDIQYILPLVFKILEISNPNDIEDSSDDEIKKYLTPFQFKTILSVLSSLVLLDYSNYTSNIVIHNTNNHKNNIPQASINCLSKYIYQLLPYLVDRIAFWNSIPNDQFIQINSSKLEFESISNLIYFYSENPLKNIDSGNWSTTIIHKGILSQYIAIIVYKLMLENSSSGVDLLLDRLCKLCCKSNLLSQFIQKVPEFMNLVLSNREFITLFPHYHIVWLFIFKCCYQLEIKTVSLESTSSKIKKNNLDEGTIAQDIDDNIKSLVERIEKEYQVSSFNENENQKLEQLDIVLNILLEAKIKISNKELSEKLFTNESIQSLFIKYERQIVSIKINQQKDQLQQSTQKRSKAQRKSFELFNYYLGQLRNKLKSLSVSNKKK